MLPNPGCGFLHIKFFCDMQKTKAPFAEATASKCSSDRGVTATEVQRGLVFLKAQRKDQDRAEAGIWYCFPCKGNALQSKGRAKMW